MLKNFFKLNTPFEEFDEARMDSQLKTSKHIVNVLFKPDTLSEKKIIGTTFENVSLSKTLIDKCTFRDCIFKDCLFIGTKFAHVEFHGCQFVNCNLYKSTFEKVYGKPQQFRSAIQDKAYANIAVHMYQQLRENYYHESQREFKNEAEYYFAKWKRRLEQGDAERHGVPWYRYWPNTALSFAYDVVLGYGYRLRNLVTSTILLMVTLIALNHYFANYFFVQEETPSVIKSIYFTVTTMATLGAYGYSPLTEMGYVVVTIDVLFGISIITATLNSIFRKVIR